MDTESPASPGLPASPTNDVDEPMEAGELDDKDEPGTVISAKAPPLFLQGNMDIGEIDDDGVNKKRKTAREIQERFLKLASMAEISSIYRNRPIWINFQADDLINSVVQVMEEIPSSRPAALNFVGLLIHENAHIFFSCKENAQLNSDVSSVQKAVLSLLKYISERIESSRTAYAVDVLKWCCNLASELSQQNSGRPLAMNSRTPEDIIVLFTSCVAIKRMIEVMDMAITKLLATRPDECMTIFFVASRYGAHFNWIWLHIALNFPGSVVEHLFTVGVDQFKAYVDDTQTKERSNVPAAVLSQFHEDYNVKFMALSEVFNFLTRRGNLELNNIVSRMIKESLESEPTKDGKYKNLSLVFFFKLVTCSVDTLRFLIKQNLELTTPLNFIRGLCQVLSIDKRLVLPSISYTEFSTQMLAAIEADELSRVLTVLMQIAYDDQLCGVEMSAETSQVIRGGLGKALEFVIHTTVRNVHCLENVASLNYAPIKAFSAGDKLQYVVNITLIKAENAPLLLRYLHAIGIMCGEMKTAEIIARLLFCCKEKKMLSVISAYLASICPFFPNVMQVFYKHLFAFRKMYIDENPGADIDTIIMDNVQVFFEWELAAEDSNLHKYFRLVPGQVLGDLLCGLFSLALEFFRRDNLKPSEARGMLTSVTKLLPTICPTKASQKTKAGTGAGQIRSVLLQGRYAYKSAIQLASILQYALLQVSIEDKNALMTFEMLRTGTIDFYNNYCNNLMDNFYQLFLKSFCGGVLLNNENLFGEKVCLDPWKEQGINRDRYVDEDDFSFVKSLETMAINYKVVQLAHCGTIGKGARKHHESHSATNDQLFRRQVFIDSMSSFCCGDKPAANMINSKRVAQVLCEVVCQDALSADMLFADWDLEKETISKYLEIQQRLSLSWVAKGLLNILSQSKPAFWYCLPILKAMLAAVMVRFDSAMEKTIKPTEDHLAQFDDIYYLLRKSSLLPAKFDVIVDLLPEVSFYEGYLLMLEIWKYYQRRTITLNSVEHAVSLSIEKNDDAAILTDSWEGDFDVYRMIIQKNIAKLGYMIPILFQQELSTAAE